MVDSGGTRIESSGTGVIAVDSCGIKKGHAGMKFAFGGTSVDPIIARIDAGAIRIYSRGH